MKHLYNNSDSLITIRPSSFEASPPSDRSIANISNLLLKQAQKKQRDAKYAPIKDVLTLLGAGVGISALILVPKSAIVIKSLLKESQEWNQWKQFNLSYLKRTLKRLQREKSVKIVGEGENKIIRLTKNGKQKILKFAIDNLSIEPPKRWDGKWRLVIYDVPSRDKYTGDKIRRDIRALGFYAIQDSVYLFPYPCFEQIEFLREYYALGDDVQYMVVEHVERDSVFKTYFGLS